MKSWWLTVGGVFLALCLDSGLEAAENRVVEIIYDFRKGQTDCRPQIRVDTILVHNNDGKGDSDKTKTRIHQFEIRPTDNVILIMKWQCGATTQCDSTASGIQYTVMGKAKSINVLKVLLENLTKLTMPTTSKEEESSSKTGQFAVSKVNNTICLQLLPVKDDLVAGGHLIVAFNKTKDQNGEDLASSGPWIFRIGTPPPRFTVSQGLVITNVAKPTVAITKGNDISKTENGQSQYEQQLQLLDAEEQWRLFQSPVTFLNLKPWSGWLRKGCWGPYLSVGFQVGKQPFDDLVVGLTWRRAEGGIGVNLTFGGVISRGTEIDKNSGFVKDQKIDSSTNLTVNDIPTQILYNVGLAFGLSLDF